MKLNELEIKIKIPSETDFQLVDERCQAFCAPPVSHANQMDEYFDTKDLQLKGQDLVIRIRSIGNRKTIAMKSPRIELASGATSRIELEFDAPDGEGVDRQLRSQGLFPNEAAEKERWAFAYKTSEIVVDRLPFIGSFIEIEGDSEETIEEIVTLLHLTSFPVVRKNYGELMLQKFREIGLPVDFMQATFAQ